MSWKVTHDLTAARVAVVRFDVLDRLIRWHVVTCTLTAAVVTAKTHSNKYFSCRTENVQRLFHRSFLCMCVFFWLKKCWIQSSRIYCIPNMTNNITVLTSFHRVSILSFKEITFTLQQQRRNAARGNKWIIFSEFHVYTVSLTKVSLMAVFVMSIVIVNERHTTVVRRRLRTGSALQLRDLARGVHDISLCHSYNRRYTAVSENHVVTHADTRTLMFLLYVYCDMNKAWVRRINAHTPCHAFSCLTHERKARERCPVGRLRRPVAVEVRSRQGQARRVWCPAADAETGHQLASTLHFGLSYTSIYATVENSDIMCLFVDRENVLFMRKKNLHVLQGNGVFAVLTQFWAHIWLSGQLPLLHENSDNIFVSAEQEKRNIHVKSFLHILRRKELMHVWMFGLTLLCNFQDFLRQTVKSVVEMCTKTKWAVQFTKTRELSRWRWLHNLRCNLGR